jgi:hypothetical protein
MSGTSNTTMPFPQLEPDRQAYLQRVVDLLDTPDPSTGMSLSAQPNQGYFLSASGMPERNAGVPGLYHGIIFENFDELLT